jgi:hypothetical protein
MSAQSLNRLERSSPKTGEPSSDAQVPNRVFRTILPFWDKIALVARNLAWRRTGRRILGNLGFLGKQDLLIKTTTG